MKTDWTTAAKLLLEGKTGILPTDTIYGFSTKIDNLAGINRIYRAKSRNPEKPLVILAASPEQILEFFPVKITPGHREVIKQSEESPISIIYPIHEEAGKTWSHPHYPGDSLAIRIPYQKPELVELLRATGPIVSTSVNQEGEPSKTDPRDIEQSFASDIDFIIDEGLLEGQSSQIIRIKTGGEQEVLR